LTHDEKADAVYIRLRDAPYAYGEDLDASRRVDIGTDGLPIGVELLDVSDGINVADLPEQAAIAQVLAEHHIKLLTPNP
jgi:uncharacterized protein YuzE